MKELLGETLEGIPEEIHEGKTGEIPKMKNPGKNFKTNSFEYPRGILAVSWKDSMNKF